MALISPIAHDSAGLRLRCGFLGNARVTQTLTQNVDNEDLDVRTGVATFLEFPAHSSRPLRG